VACRLLGDGVFGSDCPLTAPGCAIAECFLFTVRNRFVRIRCRTGRRSMKKIEAIIKPFKLEDVKEALSAVGIQA